jgi:hypothetical protein
MGQARPTSAMRRLYRRWMPELWNGDRLQLMGQLGALGP